LAGLVSASATAVTREGSFRNYTGIRVRLTTTTSIGIYNSTVRRTFKLAWLTCGSITTVYCTSHSTSTHYNNPVISRCNRYVIFITKGTTTAATAIVVT
jgi:hypothetical protein